MKKYDIVAILWEDHIAFDREPLKKNPESTIIPTLSIGIVIQETEKVVVLANQWERYTNADDFKFLVLLKPAIIERKTYGTIKLRKPRF